jgi:tetratricopeptide (TPR) repeat protein
LFFYIKIRKESDYFKNYSELQQRLIPYSNFVRRRKWSDSNIAVWGAFNESGNLFRNQGKLKDAEEMYRRALLGKKKALGPDDSSTLNTVHNLGLLFKDQGNFKEAEEMYRRALAGKEETLGLYHISTLDSVNNLGLLSKDRGKLEDAEKMLRRALVGREKALGQTIYLP